MYPDETSGCSKTNSLLERQRAKKCEPQLLRSLPLYLLIPLKKARGWGWGGGGAGVVLNQYLGIGKPLIV